MYEHSIMKRVSMKVSDSKLSSLKGKTPSTVESLLGVANAFSQLQDKRKIADYDNSKIWDHTEALKDVTAASDAFAAWQSIKHEKIAQDYLVSLLIKPRD